MLIHLLSFYLSSLASSDIIRDFSSRVMPVVARLSLCDSHAPRMQTFTLGIYSSRHLRKASPVRRAKVRRRNSCLSRKLNKLETCSLTRARARAHASARCRETWTRPDDPCVPWLLIPESITSWCSRWHCRYTLRYRRFHLLVNEACHVSRQKPQRIRARFWHVHYIICVYSPLSSRIYSLRKNISLFRPIISKNNRLFDISIFQLNIIVSIKRINEILFQ